MPNLFAMLMLLLWPVVAVALYSSNGVGLATIWTIVGAQLLLPVGAEIKFDMIPAFDKASIPNLSASLCCLYFWPRTASRNGRFGAAESFIFIYVLSPLATAVFNQDALIFGSRYLQEESYYDALSAIVSQVVTITPFILGRVFLRSSGSIEQIMRTLVISGMVYSLPLLFEIRMSPQLHAWIYGTMPSDFIQEVREGGYRPMVFMGHGLTAAFFVMMSAVASATLWKSGIRNLRLPASATTAYLGALLVLCKSGAALMYAVVLLPLIGFFSIRRQIHVAVILVSLALLYPVLRIADLVPTRMIVETASLASNERAASLEFRFANETQLLERAVQRPVFGWGRFGRSRIYDDDGKDISVTDGHWIITMGQFGLVGFLAEFGLLALAVFRSVSVLRFPSSSIDKTLLGGLALIVSASIVNLLPNGALLPWTWLFSGALLGRMEMLAKSGRPSPRKQSKLGMDGKADDRAWKGLTSTP